MVFFSDSSKSDTIKSCKPLLKCLNGGLFRKADCSQVEDVVLQLLPTRVSRFIHPLSSSFSLQFVKEVNKGYFSISTT